MPRSTSEINPQRNGLSFLIPSFFHVFGFVSFFTLRARLLFKALRTIGSIWDDTFIAEHIRKLTQGYSEIPLLSEQRVHQQALTSNDTHQRVEFPVFVDASPRAYETVSYTRMPFTCRQMHTRG